MHIIGFSHDYTKLHSQEYGTLLAVRSTALWCNRPDGIGLNYDTEYWNPKYLKLLRCEKDAVMRFNPRNPPKEHLYYPLSYRDFAKPLLQLVFIGNRQIPFTTYREFPKRYKPFCPESKTYDKSLPYSDLIGQPFGFKFKGKKLPEWIAQQMPSRKRDAARIFE